jgi:hypothetical protein
MFQLSGETCAGTNANRLRRRSQAKTPMRKLHNRPRVRICIYVCILYLSINKTMSRANLFMSARLMQPRTKEIIAQAASDFNKSVPHLCAHYNIMPAFGLGGGHNREREEVSVCERTSARSELFIISNKLIMRPGADPKRASVCCDFYNSATLIAAASG